MKSHNNRDWEPWEDRYLKKKYPIQSNHVKDIASHLKRSESAIYGRAQVLGLKRSVLKRFIPADPESLDWKIWHYRKNKNLSATEIGDKLGLRKGQIQHRMYSRNLHLHPPAGPMPSWLEHL
jgi:hypothetical protein